MSDTDFKKIVYFVRHGESEGNAAPVFQAPDSPLNAKGKEQAISIAQRVANLSFDTLISSPWPRTRETAQAIAKTTNKTPHYEELFVERIKPTRLNGKPYSDEEANALWKKWDKSLHTSGLRVEDGENFDDIIARADKALDFLKNRPEKSILVVGHGFFMKTIFARVLLDTSLSGDNFRNFQARAKTENTGLSALIYDKVLENFSWRMWIYNDHAHLG
ncbi:histidine phosphatase family protein [Acetobacteraceae bacterium]|nr:histidine phosphatase family protein [Candidatus Parcubacteria bacterium]